MDKQDKIELIKLLEQKKELEEDNKLKNFVPTQMQKAYLFCKAKIAVLLGSNQCGKSTVLAVDNLIKTTGIVPDAIKGEYPEEVIKSGEYWISSLDFTSTIEVTMKKIKQYMPYRFVIKENKEIKQLLFKTVGGEQSEIIFKSQESGWEKYKGTTKRQVSLDEEHVKPVYDECFMRTIALGGFLRLAYTPDKGMTWGYPELHQKAGKYHYTENIHGLKEDVGIVHTLEEIAKLKERRIVVKFNPSSESNEDIEVFTMRIYDNPYLSDIEIRRTEEKWKDNPAMYFAKILGGFAKDSGRNVFPKELLMKKQLECPLTFWKGDIVDGQLKQHPKGRLVIFKDLKKIHENNFVAGVDISEGTIDGDYSCIQIMSRNFEQWASWHGRCSLDELGVLLYSIGNFFNYALLVPEINFQGYAVINALKGKYLNIYSEYDVVKDVIGVSSQKSQKRYGWRTDVRTKPIMIHDLLIAIKNNKIKINDINTIEELLTYSYNQNGSMEAMGGCYDDRVMALALAYQGLIRKPYRPMPKASRSLKRNKTDDFGYMDSQIENEAQ
ncbi:MAG: hypothetical protein ACHQ1D_00840 [Nitrososphaerales archaeon]